MRIEDIVQDNVSTRDAVTISPSFLMDAKTIHIPSKVESVIRQSRIKKKLSLIHKDPAVATEFCLMFLSNLSSTYMTTVDGWKNLNSEILRKQLQISSNGREYLEVIKLLSDESNFRSGAIIEVHKSYYEGVSRQYRLHSRFFGKGVVPYVLQTEQTKNLRRKAFYKALSQAQDNTIASHLLNKVYPYIDLPTEDEIHEEAARIIAREGKVSKGKTLTYLGLRRKDRVDTEKYSLVEDCLDVFRHLTNEGLMIPTSSANAGGRVVDSLNLMPKWIRGLVKVNNKRLVECDFTCLHPNIANALYGNGELGHISHEGVAKDLGLTKAAVKVEHLSFFNKRVRDMKRSPLFDYYKEKAPLMLDSVMDRKKVSHKDVTVDMFTAEVDIMTECIERFEKHNISAVYVFDALYISKNQQAKASQIMNEVAEECGVLTHV